MRINIVKPGYTLISKLYHNVQVVRRQEWESDLKKRFNYCGKSVSLGWKSTILNPQMMVVKDYVHIGSNAWIQASRWIGNW